ncbi:hypothetical protein DH2020_027803 [Rehmannia glutinosa]|uniref:Senescence regulator n=1 Tax=Rehmannia glutinosa TaxID=99300 RepID=A0ABR0VV33_REHGL
MEELGGGAARFRHQRKSPPSDRFLGLSTSQSSSSAPPLELSEHDIFNTPSGGSSPSPTHPGSSLNPARNVPNHNRGHYGILAALNDNLKTRSGSDCRPVFNHKASTSASLSSSSSTSPATSASSRMINIPRRPAPPPAPVDRMRLRHQSAPINVPVIPAAMMRRERELEDIVSEEEEEEEGAVRLPPHEVVAARDSPLLACSVLEGAGRTLKGRDLRQVRNAIWRKTGFID